MGWHRIGVRAIEVIEEHGSFLGESLCKGSKDRRFKGFLAHLSLYANLAQRPTTSWSCTS